MWARSYVEVIPLETFGRRLVVSAKQNLNQRIKEIERELIYNEYSNTIGEIIVGEIYQIRRNEILINHNRNELILPKSEQIFKERYKKGDTIRAVVKEVRKNAGNPAVIVSRADPQFLAKLFELEIPEIYDGIIEIKRIAREPGERAKVAVESHDDRIDAVGACVGMKGVRIHTIVRELNNENIDVINFSRAARGVHSAVPGAGEAEEHRAGPGCEDRERARGRRPGVAGHRPATARTSAWRRS